MQLHGAVFHVISSIRQLDITPSAAMSWIKDVQKEMPPQSLFANEHKMSVVKRDQLWPFVIETFGGISRSEKVTFITC